MKLYQTLAAVGTALALSSSPAQAACEPAPAADAPPPGLAEQVDGAFGAYLVAPLASVLFFDIVFWDNTLPVGQAPPAVDPTTLGGEDRAGWIRTEARRSGPELVAYDPGRGYVYRCREAVRTTALKPVLAPGARLKRGVLDLSLTEEGDRLVGSWAEMPVDPVALGIVPAPGTDPGAERPGVVEPVAAPAAPETQPSSRILKQVRLDALAPFPVVVDLTNNVLMAGSTDLSWSEIPVTAGVRARLGGREVEVAAVDGRRASIRGLDDQVEAGPLPNPANINLPFVVLWLVIGAIFFTLRFGFVNLRAFVHALAVTAGRYDHKGDPGEVSHFQALASALSATVGLGNIAGVAVAVGIGGPGAVVWMMIAGFFGMTSKFTEVTLGQMYREIKPDGTVSGGPMHYLSKGLADLRLAPLGMVLAVTFAVMTVGGSLGGGNMFQGNQAFQAMADVVPALRPRSEGTVLFERIPGEGGPVSLPAGTTLRGEGQVFVTAQAASIAESEVSTGPVPVVALKGGTEGNLPAGALSDIAGVRDAVGRLQPLEDADRVRVVQGAPTTGGGSWGFLFGVGLAVAVGVVIIGGIRRIAATAELIVPVMGVVYVLAGLWVLVAAGLADPEALLRAFAGMFQAAFSLEAGLGGLAGAIVNGFRRASFSNEAGVGSASIAHAAAATREPVREGVVALLEPFIDTIVICTITGLVVVSTGAYTIQGADGITMTSAAFNIGGVPFASWILGFVVFLFAYSTMISWSYYGDRAATWLLGDRASLPYKVLFLVCVALGPVFTLTNVIDFSDLMILGMAFPNILGLYLLSNKVAAALTAYLGKLRSGEFTQHEPPKPAT
jgi:Na+/alanine symporter